MSLNLTSISTSFIMDELRCGPRIRDVQRRRTDELLRSALTIPHHGSLFEVQLATPAEMGRHIAHMITSWAYDNRFIHVYSAHLISLSDFIDYINECYIDEDRTAYYCGRPFFGLRLPGVEMPEVERIRYSFNLDSLYRAFPPIGDRINPVCRGSETYYVTFLRRLASSMRVDSGTSSVSSALEYIEDALLSAIIIQEALEWYVVKVYGEPLCTVKKAHTMYTSDALVYGGTRLSSERMGPGSRSLRSIINMSEHPLHSWDDYQSLRTRF